MFPHHQLERLYQYKMMTDRFETMVWEADDDDTSYCSLGGGCKGHHSYDVTVAGAIVRGADGTYTSNGAASNEDVRNAIPPDTILPRTFLAHSHGLTARRRPRTRPIRSASHPYNDEADVAYFSGFGSTCMWMEMPVGAAL